MSHRFQTLSLALILVAAVACSDEKKPAAPAGGGAAKPAAAPKDGAAAPAPAAAGGKYDAAKGTATLKGMVKFKGTAPAIAKYKMDATPECAAHGESTVEKTEVNADGSLPHVFVWAVEGPAVGIGGYTAAPVEVDQVGCVYLPHVFGVTTGAKVTFKNGDKFSHNVHVKGKKQEWNKSQSAGQSDVYTPEREFGVKVICDVHSWMSSYMHVVDHTFFATSARGNGAFEIKGLYPGKYKFKAWHENWAKDKPVEFEVEVKDGENAKDIEISG